MALVVPCFLVQALDRPQRVDPPGKPSFIGSLYEWSVALVVETC